MTDATREDLHDDVELLLPWYVNGTLSDSERNRVVRHIEQCRACRNDVELLEIMSQTAQQSPAIPIVAEPKTDQLFEKIDGTASAYWRHRMIRVTAIAASLALVAWWSLQYLSDEPAPATFETATSADGPGQTDYVLSIYFQPDTADTDRVRVMRLIKASAVSREGNDSNYRVTVSLPASSLEELQRFTSDVESLPNVRSVEVIAVQLPLRPEQ